VADLNAFYVGNGIIRAWRAIEGNAEIAGAGLAFGAHRDGVKAGEKDDDQDEAPSGGLVDVHGPPAKQAVYRSGNANGWLCRRKF